VVEDYRDKVPVRHFLGEGILKRHIYFSRGEPLEPKSKCLGLTYWGSSAATIEYTLEMSVIALRWGNRVNRPRLGGGSFGGGLQPVQSGGTKKGTRFPAGTIKKKNTEKRVTFRTLNRFGGRLLKKTGGTEWPVPESPSCKIGGQRGENVKGHSESSNRPSRILVTLPLSTDDKLVESLLA